MKSAPLEFDMPISTTQIDAAQARLDFHNACERTIAEHQKRLLPWYRKSVEFPTPPYEQGRFNQYQEAISPYLRRSRLMIIVPIVGFILVLGVYLVAIYGLEK